MANQLVEEGTPDLPPQVKQFAEDLGAWAKLKVARAATQARSADSLEYELSTIFQQWQGSHPKAAKRVTRKLDLLAKTFQKDPGMARFAGTNLPSLGSIDAVDLINRGLTAAERGRLLAQVDSGAIVQPNIIRPEATNTILRLHTRSLHCTRETREASASDEIVWSATWVTPTGGTGYRWWRRENFDRHETKSIEWTGSFSVPQRFPNRFSFIFSMLEEDQTDAASVIEQTWARLRERVNERINEFAEWLAGELGIEELGPIISSILRWVAGRLIEWLVGIFGPDPMGTLTYTVTLNGGTNWTATRSSTLPTTIRHAGSGGRYEAVLAFELA